MFVIKKKSKILKVKNFISDRNGEGIVEKFYVKVLQKTNQKELRFEKVIERKGDKLYVTWKGYDNSFNAWVDKN